MKVIVIFTLVICGIGVESLAEKVPVTLDGAAYFATSEKNKLNADLPAGLDFGPQYAFKRESQKGPWISASYERNGQLPQTVHVRLPSRVSVSGFSFRSSRVYPTSYSPTKFDFIGSNDDDCKSWTVIVPVSGIQWNQKDEQKSWDVPRNIRAASFRCYGIRVHSTPHGIKVAIQDVTLFREKLVEYVKVTSEIGTAYASSEYKGRTGFEADKAFGEDGYWCSVRGPDTPVRLWFQFKEPTRVVQIKFKEQYKMSGEDGYQVFGSDAVDDCGGPNNQKVLTEAPASLFVTGKEFQNDQFFYCYGIQTDSYGRNNYVSAKELKFGFGEYLSNLRITRNGSPASEGLLEVFYDGQWGTVCDDKFDNVDATVVCRMLGYTTGTAHGSAAFGQGSGRIWLDDVNCRGVEPSIFDCPANLIGDEDCTHRQDVGVSCTVSCDSTWTASNHKTSNPKTCQVYADNNYCADGTYGSGWRWRTTFEDYADSEGRTALVCPECGCEGGLREKRNNDDFVNEYETPKNCSFFIFGAGKTYEVVFKGKEQGYIGTYPAHWERARLACQRLGGDLAQPSTWEEQDKIEAALRKLPTNNMRCAQYYIGVKKDWTTRRGVPIWLSGQEMESDSGLKFEKYSSWFSNTTSACGAISAGGVVGGGATNQEGIKNVDCRNGSGVFGYVCEYANASPNCIP